jgi:hypothetical protein
MSEKKQSKLYEMAVRGTEFEDEYEFELYGEPVTAVIKPLVDDEFLPIAAFLTEHLDVDEDTIEEGKAVSEAVDKVEEESEGDEPVDISQLDEEFVKWMQNAAKLGLHASYDEDGNKVEHTDEEIEFIVDEALMGGYSVELGSKVLEISGDVRDAEKFRGARGSVADSRDS